MYYCSGGVIIAKDPAIKNLEKAARTSSKGGSPSADLQKQMDALRRRVREEAMDGRYELYKTTAKHEGPTGRKQHGFPGDDELAA